MNKVIFALLLLPILSYADEVKLKAVSVHLFLEKSGVFSKDITTTKEFLTHNFIPMGEGIPENENFSSYLIKVSFSSDKEVFISGKVGNVKVINDKNKKVVLNQNISDLYVGPEKIIYKSFFVSGQACEFQTLIVSSKRKTMTKKLPFHCGE